MMGLKTFSFAEGTVVVEVSQSWTFDPRTKGFDPTGQFMACLIGGNAPGIKPTLVTLRGKRAARIFKTEAAALEAAYECAVKMGYHPRVAKVAVKRMKRGS